MRGRQRFFKKPGLLLGTIIALLAVAIMTPIAIANSEDIILPTADDISVASDRLTVIEAIPNGTGKTLSPDIQVEIAQIRGLINNAQSAISIYSQAINNAALETNLLSDESLALDNEDTIQTTDNTAVAELEQAELAMNSALESAIPAIAAINDDSENSLFARVSREIYGGGLIQLGLMANTTALELGDNVVLAHTPLNYQNDFSNAVLNSFFQNILEKIELEIGSENITPGITEQIDALSEEITTELETIAEFVENNQIIQFSNNETISLTDAEPSFEIIVNYVEDFLALIETTEQAISDLILGELGITILPQLNLPDLQIKPTNLDKQLSFNSPHLGTFLQFAKLTDDIEIENQEFIAFVSDDTNITELGSEIFTVEILMPLCQIVGKETLNSYNANCLADEVIVEEGGSGGVMDGLVSDTVSAPVVRTVYRGLTSDTVAETTETENISHETPEATEPQGEFVSIPIERSNWSLLSVLLTALVVIISAIKLIGLRNHFLDKSNALFRILSIVPATIAVIVLILLNDFDTNMLFANANTIPIAGILVVQAVLAIKSPHSEED